MTVMSNSTETEVAQLLTPEVTSATEICVRFWWVQCCHHTLYTQLWDEDFNVYLLYLSRYWIPAGPSNNLAVHVLRSGEPGQALWKRSGAPSSGWEVAEVTVSSPAPFNVSFLLVYNDHIPRTFRQTNCLLCSESLNYILYCNFSHFCKSAF